MRLNLPLDHCKRLLGVCSWKITCSSPPLRAGGGSRAGKPRLSATSTPLPAPLLSSCLQTRICNLVHQPSWAWGVWLQSRGRGGPMRWRWAERINKAWQIEWGLSVFVGSQKTSWFVWSSTQVAGYLPEVAATGCSSLLSFATPERFVEVLQEVCECDPGCLACQGGTPEQKPRLCFFWQGKLGNLCLWVASKGRMFVCKGQLALLLVLLSIVIWIPKGPGGSQLLPPVSGCSGC